MTHDQVLQVFRDTGALLEGHFVLRSGLHSRQFFQCALALQQMPIVEQLGRDPFQCHGCFSPQALRDADFASVPLRTLRQLCARPAQLVQFFVQDAPRFLLGGFLAR